MTSPQPPTVHVVDDDPTILRLFERVVRDAGWVLRTWDVGTSFLDQADLNAHGCLVLDLNLPDLSGHEVLEAMGQQNSLMPVIFMSGAAAVSDAVRALKHGSLEFVEKPFGISEMLEMIRNALEQDMASRSSTAALSELQTRFSSLTPREHEVMLEVVKGLSNKAIGSEKSISPKTVEVHRANVMHKTRAGSVAELVRMAIRLGLGDQAEGASDGEDS